MAEDYAEWERERQRNLRMNYVNSGIPSGREHEEWSREYQARGGNRVGEPSGNATFPESPPEPATSVPQVCDPAQWIVNAD